MTAASNPAAVKIGGFDLVLDEGVENHYEHTFESILKTEEELPGKPGAKQQDPARMLWSWDDWTGGEGADLFDDNDPAAYLYSDRANGRIKGQLTGRPDRTQVQVTAMGDNNQQCFLQVSQGIVYIAADEKIKQSTDYGASWAAPAGTLGITASDNISSTAGDAAYFYYAMKSGSATWEIRRLTGTSNSEAVITRTSTNPAGHIHGMCMLNGKLYFWTGRKLFECDVFETVPLTFNTTYRKVYDTGVDLTQSNYGGVSQGSWWADCVAGENAVFYFAGSEGHTEIYIYKDGVGRPLWRLPYGMTGKTLTVQNGVLYVTGHYSSEAATADGFGALWALPLKTLQETFLGFFRKPGVSSQFLHLQEAANAAGYQIMIGAAKSGKVFIYDGEFNAISLLDDLAATTAATNWVAGESKIGSMTSIGNHRIVAFFQPGGASGTTLETCSWTSDELTHREDDVAQSFATESGEYDYNYPYALKGLANVYVTFKVEDNATTSGLLANQRITVGYSLNGLTYTSLTTITSATTPYGAKGRVLLPVSTASGTTAKFYRLRLKVTIDNNSQTNVKCPVVYAVAAEAMMLEYIQRWSLIGRIKDEDKSRNARPYNRQAAADVIRSTLTGLVTSKNVIAFVDGYRQSENNTADTYNVVIERFVDVIGRNAEGNIRIDLRCVDADA